MADSNNENGTVPAWVQDAEAFAQHIKKPQYPEMNATNGQCINKCENYPSCRPCGEYPLLTKSITFDKEAQDNLPKDVVAKMKADRELSHVGNKERITKIEKILEDYRHQKDFSSYRLAAYIHKNL